MLALLSSPRRAREGLSAGARGLLDRNVTERKLARASTPSSKVSWCSTRVWIADLLRPPRRELDADQELTLRELEVLEYLALGLSNKQIATRLGVSFHTVMFHVNSFRRREQPCVAGRGP